MPTKKRTTRTKSPMTITERRLKAYELFAQGYTVAEVARKVRVHRDTAASYKKRYEAELKDEAAANPHLLTDVLTSTYRSLNELDLVRKTVWTAMKDRKVPVEVTCEECGHEQSKQLVMPISDQAKIGYSNTLLKAHDQRAKLFGLMGVKQEIFAVLQQVDQVQRAMLEWMSTNLCLDDREKLALWLERTFPQYMPAAPMPAITAGGDDVVVEPD